MSNNSLFTKVEMTHIKSNVFDLTHDVKMSLKMGELVPCCVLECVPGDKFSLSCESLVRIAPQVAPPMHRFDITMHYWFVPNRIMWEGWEDYISEGDVTITGGNPYIEIQGNSEYTAAGSLWDYLGLPLGNLTGDSLRVNAFPFAAYQFIYKEYYRDQNLITEGNPQLIGGNNSSNYLNLVPLRKRAWEHDYFTSCLPFAQKGDPVTIPLGTFSDVPVFSAADVADPDTVVTLSGQGNVTNPLNQLVGKATVSGATASPNTLWADTTSLTADAAVISDLRRAFKLQEFLEKSARGGTRYSEFILSMFGVKSSDARLQRPEYITGVKTPIVISEVLNTNSGAGNVQGEMAGHAVGVVSGGYGNYYCEEHGFIIGIMSVMPKTAYQQNLPKWALKTNDRFDYYFEQFAHIGEQEVQEREIYGWGNSTGTFGYIPRYSEYKFENNRVAGDFRTTLDFWHASRIFTSQPVLNQEFIECVPRLDFLAVDDGTDYVWCHVLHKIKAQRKMAYYGSPHF